MRVFVNGEEFDISSESTVASLLAHLELSSDKVMACAVDGTIVKKDQWTTCILVEDQKLELLNFVGGG
jgi:sulfur carrier protein